MKKNDEISKVLKKIEIFTNRKVDEIFAGNYKSSFKGHGLEVDELRKYEEGDDARHIDWITTAKSGTPFVKKYKESRELTNIILVDVSASMNFGSTEKSKKDVAIELIATILFSSLKNNDKFGAIIFCENKISFIPPKKGKTHLMRILRDVTVAFSQNIGLSTNLNPALKTLMSAIKRSAIVFLISDEISSESSKLLGVTSKKHDFVYMKVNDPFEQGKIGRGLFEVKGISGNGSDIINLNNQKTIENFRKIREEKLELERNILKEKHIDYQLILTDSNIYKELISFFKKRQFKY